MNRELLGLWLPATSLRQNNNKIIASCGRPEAIKMRDFKKYDIWNDSMKLVKQVYQFSETLPKEEKFGFVSQMCRAAISIPSNIAEGTSRNSDAEFKRFLEIAIGSSFELETQLL